MTWVDTLQDYFGNSDTHSPPGMWGLPSVGDVDGSVESEA